MYSIADRTCNEGFAVTRRPDRSKCLTIQQIGNKVNGDIGGTTNPARGYYLAMSVLAQQFTSVLVVEDEDLIRMITVLQLEDEGFAVIEARDADEALIEFKQHPEVAAVFTDINMPGAVDGVALAHRLHDLRPNVQLIITSGRGPPSPSEMPLGARFLPKPYDGRALAGLIQRRLGARPCPPAVPTRPNRP